MVITYTNTTKELYDYLLYKRTHDDDFRRDVKTTRTIYIFMAVVLAIFTGFQVYRVYTATTSDEVSSRLGSALSSFIMMAVSVAFIFLVPVFRRLFIRHDLKKELAKNKDHMAAVTLEIDAKTFKWKGSGTNGAMRITEKREITETPDCWYITTHKPAASLVVPKRVLDEPAAADFKRLLNIH